MSYLQVESCTHSYTSYIALAYLLEIRFLSNVNYNYWYFLLKIYKSIISKKKSSMIRLDHDMHTMEIKII